jgi:type II secretory pathway component PulC
VIVGLGGCREAAEAADIDVDAAQRVAERTGEEVVAGIDTARKRVEAVGGELRDAAEQAQRSAGAVGEVDADERRALQADAATAIQCPTEGSCTIERSYADRLRRNPGVLASMGRVEPHEVDGRRVGIRVSQLEPMPQRLGFRDDDVIYSINGVRLQSLQAVPQLLLQLRSARRFTIAFARDGQQRRCEVDIL